jgi:flagellar hook-associated protein 2
MSTSGLSLSSATDAPITVTGLASGLDTSSIISELMNIERQPVTHLSEEQTKIQSEESKLQSIQSSLQQLSSSVSEFSLPSLFENSQTVTSNEPTRVSAITTSGAAVGGYEVEVTQLANSAQRTFTFASPASEDKLTVDGQEFTVKAGGSANELANAINSDSKSTVFAAVLSSGELVLSNRATGNTGTEFIKVVDTGATLVEKAGTAKEGRNAEFSVDGTVGSSASNTVTSAIAGVTLTLSGLTPQGPVTVDVQPPGPNSAAVEAQVQSFLKLYNSTVESIETELNTKPPAKALSSGEPGTGVLFGDTELQGLLNGMRQAMYEPIAGLESEISSPADIGISTGAPTGGSASTQSSLNGILTLDPAKFSEAVKGNPAAVEKMMRQWSSGLQKTIEDASGPGGTMEARVTGDASQITQLTSQIGNMNEMLAHREKALQATYAELESVIAQNTAQDNFLTRQAESLGNSSKSSA